MCLAIPKSTRNLLRRMLVPKHLGPMYTSSSSYRRASMFDSMRWRALFGERDLRLGGSRLLHDGVGFLLLLSPLPPPPLRLPWLCLDPSWSLLGGDGNPGGFFLAGLHGG